MEKDPRQLELFPGFSGERITVRQIGGVTILGRHGHKPDAEAIIAAIQEEARRKSLSAIDEFSDRYASVLEKLDDNP